MPLEDDKSLPVNTSASTCQSRSDECSIIRLKLPNFWPASPITWFIQAEAQFSISRVLSDSSRYNHVLAALPQDIIESILDFVQCPPEKDLYKGIKDLLIERHSMSEERRLEKLLSSEQLGDRRPSDFYRSLKLLAGTSGVAAERLVRNLWLRRLPQVINIAVISLGDKAITEVLTLADKIFEATSHLELEIQELKKLINNLSFNNNRSRSPYCSNNSRNQSFRPRAQFRSNSSNRSSSRNVNRICWYHRRYSHKATKCVRPCDFKHTPNHTSKPNDNQKN